MKAIYHAGSAFLDYADSNYSIDRKYAGNSLFSIRANQLRLISVIDVTAHISFGALDIAVNSLIEGLKFLVIVVILLPLFVFAKILLVLKPNSKFNALRDKFTLGSFIKIILKCSARMIGGALFVTAVRICVIFFDILGIIRPELGRIARNLFITRNFILDDLQKWVEINQEEALKILGMEKMDTPENIKEKFKQLALSKHPDKFLDQESAVDIGQLKQAKEDLLSARRTFSQLLVKLFYQYANGDSLNPYNQEIPSIPEPLPDSGA